MVEAHVEMHPKEKSLYPYREQAESGGELESGSAIYRNRFKHERQAITKDNVRSSLDDAANSLARQILSDIAISL